jgi:hypothetical protein
MIYSNDKKTISTLKQKKSELEADGVDQLNTTFRNQI